MQIFWDEPKRQANLEKRGLDFAMITEGFFAAAVVVAGKGGRFVAIGRIDETPPAVIFAPLGSEAISIVSLRIASHNDRKLL